MDASLLLMRPEITLIIRLDSQEHKRSLRSKMLPISSVLNYLCILLVPSFSFMCGPNNSKSSRSSTGSPRVESWTSPLKALLLTDSLWLLLTFWDMLLQCIPCVLNEAEVRGELGTVHPLGSFSHPRYPLRVSTWWGQVLSFIKVLINCSPRWSHIRALTVYLVNACHNPLRNVEVYHTIARDRAPNHHRANPVVLVLGHIKGLCTSPHPSQALHTLLSSWKSRQNLNSSVKRMRWCQATPILLWGMSEFQAGCLEAWQASLLAWRPASWNGFFAALKSKVQRHSASLTRVTW